MLTNDQMRACKRLERDAERLFKAIELVRRVNEGSATPGLRECEAKLRHEREELLTAHSNLMYAGKTR